MRRSFRSHLANSGIAWEFMVMKQLVFDRKCGIWWSFAYISVPERNHPIAVPRSVGRYMSPIHDDPMVRKAVPSKAVRMRKIKYATRFGERAVPSEQAVKRKAVTRHIYTLFRSVFETQTYQM